MVVNAILVAGPLSVTLHVWILRRKCTGTVIRRDWQRWFRSFLSVDDGVFTVLDSHTCTVMFHCIVRKEGDAHLDGWS